MPAPTPEADGGKRAQLLPHQGRRHQKHAHRKQRFHLSRRGRRAELHCRAEGDRGRHVPSLLYRDERLRGRVRERPGHPASSHASVLRGESKVLQFAGEADHALDMPRKRRAAKAHAVYWHARTDAGRSGYPRHSCQNGQNQRPSRSSTAAAAAMPPAAKRPLPYIRARRTLPCACPF